MPIKEICAALSAVLILVAGPPYALDTLKGVTKPERMTWFIFSLLGIVAFISQMGLGASWSLLFSGLDTAGSCLMLLLSLKYGVGGYARRDIAALMIAIVGITAAFMFKQPLLSLAGVILADASGTALTVRKAFLDPGSETTITWLAVGTAAVFGMLAVGSWSVSLLLYPAYLVIANYAVPLAQLVGRSKHPAQVSEML
ncbi:MAG TPA: hypothetical protein VLG92_04230 [Candidatus Saccharimonadia bacterium]|nr:hypothetical protein [Candidatus Saccharimonadia bacterium]